MKLNETTTIKNLSSKVKTVIDDTGNVTKLDNPEGDDSVFDYFADDEGSVDPAIRPDGSHDGLDDLGELGLDDAEVSPEGELGDETLDAPLDGEISPEEGISPDGELGDLGEPEQEDPDFQGVIRTVTGACLVYKRKVEDGSYEELWIYNVGKNMRVEAKIRRSILAGTDIDIQGVSSEDGSQNCVTTTIGNTQFLKITGLPN
jgi:hypothetical protein